MQWYICQYGINIQAWPLLTWHATPSQKEFSLSPSFVSKFCLQASYGSKIRSVHHACNIHSVDYSAPDNRLAWDWNKRFHPNWPQTPRSQDLCSRWIQGHPLSSRLCSTLQGKTVFTVGMWKVQLLVFCHVMDYTAGIKTKWHKVGPTFGERTSKRRADLKKFDCAYSHAAFE